MCVMCVLLIITVVQWGLWYGSQNGITALMYAAQNGNVIAMTLLLGKNANVDSIDEVSIAIVYMIHVYAD